MRIFLIASLCVAMLASSWAAPSGASADQIEVLLRAGRYAEAAGACDEVANDPEGRDLAAFLVQYGRALRGTGRTREAAEMFLRVAVHFPRADEAAFCLVEAGEMVRDVNRRPMEARKLFERAVTEAAARGDDELKRRAQLELSKTEAGTLSGTR
jgi:tetratricopeptide (TPR) repeat protein